LECRHVAASTALKCLEEVFNLPFAQAKGIFLALGGYRLARRRRIKFGFLPFGSVLYRLLRYSRERYSESVDMIAKNLEECQILIWQAATAAMDGRRNLRLRGQIKI
jgi:hypothetical protein